MSSYTFLIVKERLVMFKSNEIKKEIAKQLNISKSSINVKKNHYYNNIHTYNIQIRNKRIWSNLTINITNNNLVTDISYFLENNLSNDEKKHIEYVRNLDLKKKIQYIIG